MPRAVPETRVKRILTPIVMWGVLAATVGGAALLDHHVLQSINAPLGEPEKFDGFTMALPSTWERADVSDDEVAACHDPKFGDELVITARRPGLTDLFGIGGRGVPLKGTIDFGGVQAPIMRQRQSTEDGDVALLTVSRALPQGRRLTITLIAPLTSRQMDREVSLVKRVAASVKVDAPE